MDVLAQKNGWARVREKIVCGEFETVNCPHFIKVFVHSVDHLGGEQFADRPPLRGGVRMDFDVKPFNGQVKFTP